MPSWYLVIVASHATIVNNAVASAMYATSLPYVNGRSELVTGKLLSTMHCDSYNLCCVQVTHVEGDVSLCGWLYHPWPLHPPLAFLCFHPPR